MKQKAIWSKKVIVLLFSIVLMGVIISPAVSSAATTVWVDNNPFMQGVLVQKRTVIYTTPIRRQISQGQPYRAQVLENKNNNDATMNYSYTVNQKCSVSLGAGVKKEVLEGNIGMSAEAEISTAYSVNVVVPARSVRYIMRTDGYERTYFQHTIYSQISIGNVWSTVTTSNQTSYWDKPFVQFVVR